MQAASNLAVPKRLHFEIYFFLFLEVLADVLPKPVSVSLINPKRGMSSRQLHLSLIVQADLLFP